MTEQADARQRFLKLLKDDILQLDLAELDFGIYRILNYRRKEIDAFLDGELSRRIDAALAKLPDKPTPDEQGRLFHHLYTFFARYYDDGDFVTRPRRGRHAAYSVPYNGQDVHFWWATKGSHYVKSGERFGNYVWRDGARAIRIEVAQADVEKDNVKGAKRYYLPESLDAADGALRVKLAYRPLEKDEAKRFEKKRKAEEDVDDSKADDEAVEGRNAQERILNAWFDGDGPRKAKIPAGVDKVLLRKHLNRYVAGQSSDFFVHPRLGEFLKGELDYYLKNEFLEIWDRADGDALARERGKLAVVRDIGNAIADFLAAIEDVQAQLFEKRKFVLASDWLARVSALPPGKATQALIAEVCANADQINEWLGWLGEKPLAKNAKPEKRGADLLAAYPHLCIHTRHFDAGFKYRLLALFDDIEAATGGTLIHSENYAALRTLEYAYRQRVKCIYIDPPYNADTNPIAYKNEFPESSWVSLIADRLLTTKPYFQDDSVLCVTIDDYEANTLGLLLDRTFGKENQLGVAAIRNNPSGRSTVRGLSVCHEYAFFYGASAANLDRLPRSEKQLARFTEEEGLVVDWRNFRKDGGAVTHRVERPKQYYPIYVRVADRSFRIPDIDWDESARRWIPRELPRKDEIELFPVDEKGRDRVWSLNHVSAKANLSDLEVRLSKDGMPQVFRRHIPNDGVLPRSWWDKNIYAAREYGSATLTSLFGESIFPFAKSPFAVQDCIWVSGLSEESDRAVLDYFAGSGTTAHAVINLNREDGGTRRFVLVEQGEYFDTVLLPRIAKVIACPEWKDGKPKDGVAMTGDDEHWSARSPALVQVLRLERYEDSLDALELPSEEAARRAGQRSFAGDSLLRYVHEAAAGKASVTLNHAGLAHPFDYAIPQTRNGAAALAAVDFASTALLLLGLHAVRVRDVARKDKTSPRYLFVEARPNGKSKDLHLLFLRDCDDSLVGEPLRKYAEAEMRWLDDTIAAQFGRKPGDYTQVWYNRDAVLSSPNGRSLDPEVIRRMLERAPEERSR